MTYKLEPWIEKITSCIKLIFPKGFEIVYRNGKEAAEAVFEKRWGIKELRQYENIIEVKLEELPTMPVTNWIGEEQVVFNG